jgi:hypothetical protein
VRRDDVLWRRVGDTVLLRPRHRQLVLLQGTAPAMWEQLEHPISIRELAQRLAELYETTEDTVEADVVGGAEVLIAAEVARWT